MTEPVHGLPPLLRSGLAVAVVPPQLRQERWHTVLDVSDEGGTGQLVALSGIGDLSAAKSLAGRTILANVDDLPAGFELHDVDALLGREVSDATWGPLGSIVEVMRGVANDVWVIDGPHGEVLLPVVEAVVSSVPARGPIEVCAPDGTVAGDAR